MIIGSKETSYTKNKHFGVQYYCDAEDKEDFVIVDGYVNNIRKARLYQVRIQKELN